jgi:hypothetical protein
MVFLKLEELVGFQGKGCDLRISGTKSKDDR